MSCNNTRQSCHATRQRVGCCPVMELDKWWGEVCPFLELDRLCGGVMCVL